MLTVFALIVMLFWVATPNLVLLAFTQDEDYHLAMTMGAFIPWTLFGLYLIG